MLAPFGDPATRLGPERLHRRLAREAVLLRRKQHRGPWALKRLFPFRPTVRLALRLSGLEARAYREFLDVRVEENVVRLPGLPPEFDGFRLLQLSDLHTDIDRALVDRIAARLDGLAFDQAVLTGDYHDIIGTPWEEAVALTLGLVPLLGPAPLAVLGNHDFLAKVPLLEAGGLRVLLNESVALPRAGARLWICGVDDPHSFRTHDLAAAAADVPSGDCRVLLAHSPEVAGEAAAAGYALQLSGHTHGGQICGPGGFPIVRKAAVPRPLLAGPWRVGEMAGYTSRGTGSCSVPARLNCPPEITVHILRCA